MLFPSYLTLPGSVATVASVAGPQNKSANPIVRIVRIMRISPSSSPKKAFLKSLALYFWEAVLK